MALNLKSLEYKNLIADCGYQKGQLCLIYCLKPYQI